MEIDNSQKTFLSVPVKDLTFELMLNFTNDARLRNVCIDFEIKKSILELEDLVIAFNDPLNSCGDWRSRCIRTSKLRILESLLEVIKQREFLSQIGEITIEVSG